jgi:predicted dehydrogenase
VSGPRAATSLAVLGFGSIGRRHASIAREHGYDVRVFDPALTGAAPDGLQLAGSAEEALDGARVAIVASPTSVHLEQATLAIEHSCHVLVEKPLATHAAGADALLHAARERGQLLAVAMNLRFHPGPRGVHEVVHSGAIGRPLLAHFTFGSYLPHWRPQDDYRTGYSARSELGGGVLLDVIHEIDYAVWILGTVDSVSAHVAHVSDLEVDVEDMATVQLHFTGGAVASMDLDYLDRSYRRGCRIVGSEGSVAWSWHEEHIVVYGRDGAEEVRPTPSDVAPSYREQFAAFLSAVTRERPQLDDTGLVTGSEALRVLRIVDAARESSQRGCRVAVTPR